jgi:UDP-N-acetylmuramyl pentapeptide phosphotransferase/UDP-N-acetylglucosamine-1-phosphate transferase
MTNEMKSKKLRQGLKFCTSMMGVMVILCVFGAILALINHEWLMCVSNLFWAYIAYGKYEDLDAIRYANDIMERQDKIIHDFMELYSMSNEAKEQSENESNNN